MTVMSLSRDLKDDFHSDTVLSILNEQRIRGILCDVTIIVEDTKFKAHSNVLAASSLYFKNIFWSHTICISSHVLELDDLKAEVFTEILNYIYSSTVVVKRQETVTDLAAAGKKLGISFLEDLSDRNFSNSPGPYVVCITEKGVVKEEKNEKRHEEPAVTNGPRITNAFSIIETENSNNMFSPLDLRASFKKVSDSMRTASLCQERASVCHEVEPVRTLAEHSYAVSSITEAYRSQPPREQDSSSSAKTGKETGDALATKVKPCRKPKPQTQDSDSTTENMPLSLVTCPEVNQERSPQPAPDLSHSEPPSNEGDIHFPGEDENQPSDAPGPGAAEVPPLVYNCSCCSKSFDSSTLLSAHMQLHKPTQEPFVCKYCNKQFTTLNRLDRHEQICMRSSHVPIPGGNPPFLENYPTIGQDGSSFRSPESLGPENRIGELSSSGSALSDTDHMVKFVNGQMLYSCIVCKRSYVTLSSLRRHANVHSWRRTYPCHYCNKVFALAEYRTRHEIWHTGERRYQCIFCLETFMTYYILKNHQKSFHAIDHRLSINKKTANGGLKPTVYPYKLYRLLPMRCKRAPYKSYRNSSYVSAQGSSQRGESAPDTFIVPNLQSSEMPTLDFQDGRNTLPSSPAVPVETPSRQGAPTSARVKNAEGIKWRKQAVKTNLVDNFDSTEVSVSSTGNTVSATLQTEPACVSSVGKGSEHSASVISYSGSVPSVIVHSSQFSSVIKHSNTIASLTNSNHKSPSQPVVSPSLIKDSKPETDKASKPASRPKSIKEKKKTAPSNREEITEEAKYVADHGGSSGKTTNAEETSKIETYIAKPALPGTSTNSNVAPLCQITVKIGNEAIVKRHILGSKLFYKRGRKPKYQMQEETLPRENDPETPGDSPLGLCQAECVEMSEAFDEVSDQDSTDKPWRPYYNYKPKKKSKQLRKMRKVKWRKERRSRSPVGRCRYPAELDRAEVKLPPDKAFEEEEEENKEMPKLQCELCDGCPDGAAGAGAEGKPHQHLTSKPYICELCAKQFQSSSTLKMHMRCHTGEKPYQCKTCGRCFSVQGNLQKHERIHLGVKEFICQYCNKAFTLNETLKIHERIHTGEKRYHCQFCFQGFLYLSTKRNHERRHIREHDGKGFACFQCPKICKTAAALRMHQKKHLYKTLPKQEETGDTCHENADLLESQLCTDSEDSEQKDDIKAFAENVL